MYDAVVIGGGHNGLVCAAYLARAGMCTVVVEARASVGGTAASDDFAGARVNICNCDHLTFRTTPVIDELGLAAHGLRYIDLDPAQVNAAWSGGPAWTSFHEVDRTIDALAVTYPSEVTGYRRYLADALPAARLILAAANERPTLRSLSRLLVRHRGRGAATVLRWSRRSAADVLRHYFTSDALQGPAAVTGPMVWGVSPEAPHTGLGALTYALRHVGRVGRPAGGSGMVPASLAAAFIAYGGEIRTGAKVATIPCDGERVRGVILTTGEELRARIVVSACNPHDTFVEWLSGAPPQARALVHRWREMPAEEGYESKIDAVVDRVPLLRALGEIDVDRYGERLAGATTVVAPSLAQMHRGSELMTGGEVLEQPAMMVNVPSVVDPGLAPQGGHVFSMEVLYTPYRLRGGWASSTEPRRWLERYATLVDGDLLGGLRDWRAMTPEVYERDFHLPAGHATSFSGGPLAAIRSRDPELTRYETPVRGLYLTGAATFPGAGVWGASGRNAALTILR